LDGELLTEFRSDKARALLAYLPLEAGEPIRRNLLKALLSDGYDSKSASLSLRVALSNLSKILKPLNLLTVTRQTVQFNLSSDEVLSATQEPRAKDILEKAHKLLQERATKISDERLRQTYLENVPAHREIVALCKRVSENSFLAPLTTNTDTYANLFGYFPLWT
jgi:DNA-binding SARP family transcriptional activator